ncbi:MAG: pantetheine-phosphate adenylyltransferase [Tissierellia bacterium]|nr:pantetheine-phosphate adenylyltransferase [Tissierellia bacterium]
MIALYPGSFDPITNGHINVMERASKLFDTLVVSILINQNKKSLFTLEERMEFLKGAIGHIYNIRIESFQGLLVDYAKEINAGVIVRGLRAVSDFEYEMQMALMNNALEKDVDTIFLCADGDFTFLSSSVVKEVASFGGDVSKFVPSNVKLALDKKFGR